MKVLLQEMMLVILLTVVCSSLLAHPDTHFNGTSYTVEDGLPTNLVKTTIQDSAGYIWIATDAGLICFDGYEFNIFTHELPSPYVKNLFITADNRFFIITDMGISEVTRRKQQFQFKTVFWGTNLSENPTDSLFYPKAIYLDQQGRYWIAEPGALVKIDDNQFKRFRLPEEVRAQSYIHSFHFLEDQWGHLLIFSHSGYTFSYQPQLDSIILLNEVARLPSTIEDIVLTDQGEVLAGGSGGVFKITLHPNLKEMHWEKVLNIQQVQALCLTGRGDLYIGTAGGGVYTVPGFTYNPDHVHHLDFTHNYVINDIYKARDGSLWISSDQGVILVKEPLLEEILTFSNFSIQNLSLTPSGKVVATDGFKVYTFSENPETGEIIPDLQYHHEKIITTVASNDVLLAIGTTEGEIEVLQGTEKSVYRFCADPVNSFLFDKEQNLWVCQSNTNKIHKITPDKKVIAFGEKEGLTSPVRVMKETPEGNLILGAEGADSYLYLYRKNQNKLENISIKIPETSANTFWVNDIAITSEDTFYLATNNGLYKYIDHQIELIPFDPFFHNSELKSITVDGAGHIWIGTSQGIFVLVQNQLIPFYLQDGLPSRTIAYRSIVSDHQDNVWIGTFQGVTRWNTQRNQFHQSPTPVILSIVVEEPGGKQYFLEKPTIERGKNLIFKVSNFVYPIHHVKYRWRIDSITRGWLESETGRDIFLHHLPPGDYTIEIQAQQSGHLWSPSATFSFTIPPPWYQTWRGYGLFFFLFVTIIFFLGKLYVLWKERKSTQESLEQLSLAVEQTGGVIFMTDKEGVITYVNQAFERVYGYRKEEALGKTPRILKSNLVPPETYKAFWDTILSGQIFEGEFVNKTKDGKLVHMKVSVAPFREKGQILGFIAAQEDISELKNAEEELKHYATELESAKIALEEHANRLSMTISELEIARLKAEEASKAKSEFVANMSHEIRTPMNGIIGMTDLALETELTEEQREYLEAVKSSANSLLTIINDILDFSKIEAGKLALEYIAFRIRPFVIETIKSQAFRAKEKNLEILYYVEPEVPEGVKGDPVRIRQILINLLGNAIKFTSHGEILLYIGLEQPVENNVAQIHLVVRDTGIGIPPEKQELIFEAFSQADTSITRKFGGTGLGLAITTQLVKLMNGKIWVESPPRYTLPGVDISDTRNGNGKLLPENITSPENNSHKSTTNQQEGAGPGSAFHIILPLEIAEPEEQPETTPVNLSELKDHKALIVDDNPTNRTILEKMLTQWGMIPISAEDGEKALERINSAAESNENFSVILLDAQMPNMDGFTLSQKIRKVPGYSAVPQIMLTSAGTRGDAQRCKELGIEGYLTKPVSMIQLQMTLYNCLSSKKVLQEKKPLITRHVIQENLPILNILLVEDNKINQKVATRMLEKMGHRITVASNGVEGVEKWKKQQFDLIFMDVQMPEMDGFEATAQIRELEKKRGTHVPIIAMTAHAMKGDRERCLAAGMDDYVAKPIKREEVEEVIQRFIHSKESTTQLDVEELENEHLE